jgi:RNA recognition motif-containing protein
VKKEAETETVEEEVVEKSEGMEEDDNDNDQEVDDNEEDDGETNEDEDEGPSGNSDFRSNRGGRRQYPRNNRAVYHQSDDSDPSCRVYVGNLSWEVTWKELKDHMKKCECEIVRADVLASPDGRSKGCGIVEFASEEGAKRALTLNDSDLMGRQIFVREDRESGSGGGYYTQQPGNATSGGDAGGNSEGGDEKQGCRVYVGNLSWDVSWQDLKDHMRSAGEASFAEVMQGSDGRSKGCGVVEFKSPEEAKVAIETLNDSELKGRMIFVREDRETSGGGRRGGGQGGGGKSTAIYVGNLAYETSWQDLKDHMRQAGNVDEVSR